MMKTKFAEPKPRMEQHANDVTATMAALGAVYEPPNVVAVFTKVQDFNHQGMNERP